MKLTPGEFGIVIGRLKKGTAITNYPGSRSSTTVSWNGTAFAWEAFDEGDTTSGTYADEGAFRDAFLHFPRKCLDRILGPED